MENSLESEFQAAAQAVKAVRKQPSSADLLTLYGLFKQAEKGSNTTPKPGFLQVEAKAKWEAWMAHRGLSRADAKREYVRFARTFVERYS